MRKNLGDSLKWSTAGELLAKLIAPISNMILARIIAPENFGILATVNMIITFVDLFTDSGFAKYLIQCDFEDSKEVDEFTNVAFWTNLLLSCVLWAAIYLFRFPLARLVGCVGYERVIVIASMQLIVTSFSSIQTALFRRYFDFKTLFHARLITAFIPICITVPLAFWLRDYRALVIGAIVLQVANAVYLTIKSSWKPKLYYDYIKLKKMFSFSVWSLAEALAYWLTTWFDVFIIGAAFSAYYLGIYKQSLNMVNSVMQLVKAAIIPVLFSSLSRLKNDKVGFFTVFQGLQESAAFILLPMGIGLFVFRNEVTYILLGSQWDEASMIVGVWALSSCLSAVFINFYGEALKAKGLPKILFLYEVVCLVIIIPICYLAKKVGFWEIVYTRASMVLIQIVVGFFFVRKYLEFSVIKMISVLFPPFICSVLMGCVGIFLQHMNDTMLWTIFSIVACAVLYFALYFVLFRKRLNELLKMYKNKSFAGSIGSGEE